MKIDFTRIVRFVLDVHKIPEPIGSTYTGVVSRKSVKVDFAYTALNSLDIFAGDIRNTYI